MQSAVLIAALWGFGVAECVTIDTGRILRLTNGLNREYNPLDSKMSSY